MAEIVPSSFLFFLFLLSSITIDFAGSTPVGINSWCEKTPYPDACQHFLNLEKADDFVGAQEKDYPRLIVKRAIDQALHGRKLSFRMRRKLPFGREKAAWHDCQVLLENSAHRLKQVFHGGNFTLHDEVTWLTMAGTNINTCQTGLDEAGVATNPLLLLHLSKNVSQLIGIALATKHGADNNGLQRSWRAHNVMNDDTRIFQGSLADDSGLIPNAVVAPDGSGNFTCIRDAIHAASRTKGYGRFVIYVKEGVYKERIVIKRRLQNITIFGDGIGKTIITESRHSGGGIDTFNSATFAVNGDGFIARDITFENTAGPSNGQAVALRSSADRSVFYRCSFKGYQDTLYVHSGRQFYRECDVTGTVDFIFGNAATILQKSNIFLVNNTKENTITITASKRSEPGHYSGIIIHDSKVSVGGTPTSADQQHPLNIYLGRPWANCSLTVFLNTNIGAKINPAGWLQWHSSPDTDCLYYGEFNNTGIGSSTSGRVQWTGYHNITDASTASQFTVANFLSGDSWIPSTNVPYTSGL